MKLHTINEKKSTKKLVGRERRATEKKCKEHNTISARRLGDALGAGEDDRRLSWEKALFLAFFRSNSSNNKGTHLVAMLLLTFFVIFSLCTTFLVGIRR
jgi:hypothetical protein